MISLSVFDKKTKKFKRRKFWYILYIEECVLCWRDDTWREKVFKKPKHHINFKQTTCGNHFC